VLLVCAAAVVLLGLWPGAALDMAGSAVRTQ
jgi:hypothetical protein